MTTFTTMPPVEVGASTPTPYPFGLLSLPVASAPADARWENGVWWPTSGCRAVGITWGLCNADAPDPIPALDDIDFCQVGYGVGFTVYARSGGSVRGAVGGIDAQLAQVRATLLAGEQWGVERAFWERLDAEAGTAATTAADLSEAVAQAEQRIANVYGGTGTIHLSRLNASRLPAGLLRANSGRLSTLLGTNVVAGGGYGEDDLDTAPVELFVTGNPVVIRGAVDDLGAPVSPTTNRISAVVFRNYVIGWDCTAIRIAVAP